MDKARVIGIAACLFLAVAVDFTGKLMSMLSDGVLVAGAIILALPLVKKIW